MRRLLVLLLVALTPLVLYAGTTEFLKPGLSGTIVGDTVFTGFVDIDATGVRIDSDGDGRLILTGLGAGADEVLSIDLDDTANTGVFASTSGLNILNFSLIDIVVNSTDPADAGAVRLGNAAVIGWEASPAAADVTLTVDTSEIMQASGTFNATTLTEGAVGVPNTGDNLSVFAATSSAQLAGVLSDETGSGTFVLTSACVNVLSTEHDPTEAGATDDYVNLLVTGLGGSAFGATETAQDMFMVPVATVARNLRAEVGVAPGAGNDPWVITLRDDAASTTLTCTISGTSTSCSDTTNAPAIAAGSKLNMLVASSGANPDPTATTVMNIAFCLGQ